MGVTTFALGVQQARRLRKRYIENPKCEPPTGPHFGTESWVEKVRTMTNSSDDMGIFLDKTIALLEGVKAKIPDVKTVLSDKACIQSIDKSLVEKSIATLQDIRENFESAKEVVPVAASKKIAYWRERVSSIVLKLYEQIPAQRAVEQVSIPQEANMHKIKLLVLGDSLVCGVGCDRKDSSPVLPQILAKVLTYALRVDVEWHSAGVVGGTVEQIREKLIPAVKSKLYGTSDDSKNDVDLIVVVICGLNDWKGELASFLSCYLRPSIVNEVLIAPVAAAILSTPFTHDAIYHRRNSRKVS
jgi:hypothetical protein